ncbi:substrate-binding domain-containing protein [Streptomyces sp. NPDC005507]|uniref:GntR family transcriptional regulator n=1 Tax=unclassified Streptomyces TaxID=2593676 RepID=UPI0033A93D53
MEDVPARRSARREGAPVSQTPQSSRELKFRRLAGELRRSINDGTWPPGSKMPTEAAMAAEMGLSTTTVRRAYEELTGQGLVVRRQGSGTFVTDRVVLRGSRQWVVGVLVPDTALYYPRVLQGMEQVLSEAQARLVLACSHYDPQAEDTAIEQLIEAGVHGLLLVPSLHDVNDPRARALQLQSLPVPVVLVERRLASAGAADFTEHVCTDHEGGAWDAVRHLHGLGHRRIGLGLRTDGPTAAPIASGYERALADFGLPTVARQEDVMDAWDADRADAAVAAFVEDGVTAVLCFGDREAALLLVAARRAGRRVPEDLSVIAYDNEFADVAEVPMTAVSPPKYRLGQMAGQSLLQRMERGDSLPVHQLHLRPRLIVRRSTTRAPDPG